MAFSIVQDAAGNTVNTSATVAVTLAATPTEGHTLVAMVTNRGTPNTGWTWPSGWTTLETFNGPDFDGGVSQIRYRVAGASEPATISVDKGASVQGDLYVVEIAGLLALDASDSANEVAASSSLASGPLAATTGDIVVIAAFNQSSRGGGIPGGIAADFTFGDGYTRLHNSQVNDSGPAVCLGYKAISGASGNQSSSATAVSVNGYGWAMASFTIAPPVPPDGSGIDWDGDGFGGTDTYDQITQFIGRWTISRGASPEITGGAQPGSATAILNNPADDRFNPLNAAGPLYGLLTDGVPAWIGVNADGYLTGDDPRGLFGGRTKDITPITENGTDIAPTVEITFEDAIGWLNRVPVQITDDKFRSHAAFRALILAAAGETRTDLPTENATMPVSGWNGSALAALEAINSANGSRHFARPADVIDDWYDYVVRNRQWRLDATVDGTVDDASGGVDAERGIVRTDGWRLSADTVINQQKVTIDPIRFTPGAVTVWEHAALPLIVTSASPQTILVDFDDYVDGPVVDYRYTGTAPTVTLTSFGASAKLELQSTGTTTVKALSIEGSLARRGAALSVVEDDFDSQGGTRGIRAGNEISGDFVGVLANAQGMAAHVVWRYGTPQYRPTLTVEDWMPYQFELDLYDVIEITAAQLGTTMLFEIVGLTHEIVEIPVHRTTYVLQECRVQTDPGWFILDSSELDGTDVLAY